MWFRNACIFKVESLPNRDDIESALTEHAIKPCPPHARYIYGWLDMLPEQKLFGANGACVFLLGKEERILPPTVLSQMVDEKALEHETKEGRSMGRSEKKQLKEELEFSLLPKAFKVMKKTFAYFDMKRSWLVVNTSSANQSEQVCSMLRKALPNLVLTPLFADNPLGDHLSLILMGKQWLPKQFALGQRCVMESPSDTSKRVTCKGYELPAEETDALLDRGLKVIEMSFEFHDRVSFSLTKDGVIKGLKSHDTLQDELKACTRIDDKAESLDASFFLLCEELSTLVHNIQKHVCEEDIDVELVARNVSAA